MYIYNVIISNIFVTQTKNVYYCCCMWSFINIFTGMTTKCVNVRFYCRYIEYCDCKHFKSWSV